MKLDFMPWKVDVDVEKTQQYYVDNDDCLDKKINQKFTKILTDEQKMFFKRLGVDIEKVKIDYHKLSDEEMSALEKKEIFDVSYLVCGKLLSITSLQAEVYCDDDVFGRDILNEVDVIEMNEFTNAIGNMQYSFKHPATAFPEKNLETWDCGFIGGKVIMKI